MMMVDDGGGRGVKNGRKSDDVINGRPQTSEENFSDQICIPYVACLQCESETYIDHYFNLHVFPSFRTYGVFHTLSFYYVPSSNCLFRPLYASLTTHTQTPYVTNMTVFCHPLGTIGGS